MDLHSAERQLQAAQRAADVESLDALLHPQVVGAGDGETGVTRMVAAVDAVQGGAVVSARLRYTRLWVREDGNWRVLAATFVPV